MSFVRTLRSLALLLSVLIGLMLPAWGQTGQSAAHAAGAFSAYLPLVFGAAIPPPPPPPASQWLSYLNSIRALANLPAVRENATYSDGAFKHSRYMVKNDLIEHTEDPGLPFYTTEGDNAAQASNLTVSSITSVSDADALDGWILGPFHGVGLLDPRLRDVGFGSYREEDGGWQMGATLNVLTGRGSIPSGFTFPVRWPANGATSWYTQYEGNEFPDPLSSCPGYTEPSGAPIYLMIGSGSLTPVVTASSFKHSSTDLEHCVYTEQTYSNTKATEPGGQQLGRDVLGSRDAVILMPRAPLTAGVYNVSLTVNGTVYSWSFTVAP